VPPVSIRPDRAGVPSLGYRGLFSRKLESGIVAATTPGRRELRRLSFWSARFGSISASARYTNPSLRRLRPEPGADHIDRGFRGCALPGTRVERSIGSASCGSVKSEMPDAEETEEGSVGPRARADPRPPKDADRQAASRQQACRLRVRVRKSAVFSLRVRSGRQDLPSSAGADLLRERPENCPKRGGNRRYRRQNVVSALTLLPPREVRPSGYRRPRSR